MFYLPTPSCSSTIYFFLFSFYFYFCFPVQVNEIPAQNMDSSVPTILLSVNKKGKAFDLNILFHAGKNTSTFEKWSPGRGFGLNKRWSKMLSIAQLAELVYRKLINKRMESRLWDDILLGRTCSRKREWPCVQIRKHEGRCTASS